MVRKNGITILFEANTPSLQDELFLNDGYGHLRPSPGSLPVLNASSKACVRPADYDGDGDLDLFVGGRVVPGRYPETPLSYLLENRGNGQFVVVQTPLALVGMVTDAQWTGLNGDGRADLVLCGEFMPVTIFLNTRNGFVDETDRYFAEPATGFWQSLAIADLNGDGKPDIVGGNLGTNTQIRTSAQQPAELLYADFDSNGSIDPFFCFYVQGKTYPFVSRDELTDQLFSMRRKFPFYKDYADATATTIFSPDELAHATKLTAAEQHSVCFLSNSTGKFSKLVLPIQAQFAPITHILTQDADHDGHTDLLLLGNKSDNRLKLGSMDANYGCLLRGNGNGEFLYISQPMSGLSVRGDVKSVVEMTVNQTKQLIIGAFNQPIQVYKPLQP